MKITETANLLANIQLIDNRRVSEDTIVAWHELVGDLVFSTALEAARLHFRESTAYLTPAHVRANAERMQIAALGPQTDDFGNELELDAGALAAYQRAAAGRGEIER